MPIINFPPISSGGVSSVTGSAPIASSGGTTPAISIPQATSLVDGYLSSTDWSTFNNKQAAGTYITSVGATSPVTSTGGTTPTIAIPAANGSTDGYLTSADWTTFNNKGSGTVTSVSGTAPIASSGGATPAISIPKATTLVDGYLSAADWATFNGKQPAGSYLTSVSVSSPLTGAGTGATPISIPVATNLVNGYLSSTDWATFNGKQDTLVSGTNIKTINSTSILGSGNISVTASPGGSTTEIQYNNAGALAGAANLQYDGANLGVGTTPDGTSWVQIAAGTATKAPLELITSAGTLMTTPDDGSIEYDGSVFYGTPIASSRGVVVTEHFVARTGTKTMTSNTSLQALFGGGSGGLTNGALTVASTETYYFECSMNLSSMSGTSGNLGFSIVGAGTATFTSAAWHAFGLDATTQTTAAAAGTSFHKSQAATGNIVTAVAGTAVSVFIKGIFRVNNAGTIIPSVQLTNAAAAVIGADTWFKCHPVGSNTVVSVGNWS